MNVAPPDSPTTRFSLIRHARTEWNEQKKIQGQSDSPLSASGVRAARAWGFFLKNHDYDLILSSDLGRSLQTADLIRESLDVPLHMDQRLREQDWGRWTGNTVAELRKEEPDLVLRHENLGWGFKPPGGEDRNQVHDRSRDALRAAADAWPGRNILVVTHEGVINCLLHRLCRRLFLPSEPRLVKPYHLHHLRWSGDGLEIESINAAPLP